MIIPYSIEFLGLSENKEYIHFRLLSESPQKIIYKLYNSYLGFVYFEGEMDLQPNGEYYVATPHTSNARYIVFTDYYTLQTVGMFGLIGNYDYNEIDKNNYIKNISKDFTNIQKWDVDYIIAEIFRDKVYNNEFVCVEEGDVVFDVGFNYGFFSLNASQYNPKKIIGFEPNPKLCKKYNFYSNLPNVQLNEFGLSDKTQLVTFYDNEASGRSTTLSDLNQIGIINSYEVQMVSINEFIKTNSIHKIDYLKVDCEGGEYAIFESIDKGFLKNNVKKIAIEFHHPPSDIKVVNLIETLNKAEFELLLNYTDGEPTGIIYARKKYN